MPLNKHSSPKTQSGKSGEAKQAVAASKGAPKHAAKEPRGGAAARDSRQDRGKGGATASQKGAAPVGRSAAKPPKGTVRGAGRRPDGRADDHRKGQGHPQRAGAKAQEKAPMKPSTEKSGGAKADAHRRAGPDKAKHDHLVGKASPAKPAATAGQGKKSLGGGLPLSRAQIAKGKVPAVENAEAPAKSGSKSPAAPVAESKAALASVHGKKLGVKPVRTGGKGRRVDLDSVCREVACDGLSILSGYCRLHYIKNWKKIKRKDVILRERKLNQFIEELIAKYPEKYIEAISEDLANDKEFAKVIHDLDLDESVDDFEGEGEAEESLIDNIKRDIEEDADGF